MSFAAISPLNWSYFTSSQLRAQASRWAFLPTSCGRMCPCLLQEGMKECSEPEAGQTLSCAFYSCPGFLQSLQIWASSYHLPVMLSGEGDREQSEGDKMDHTALECQVSFSHQLSFPLADCRPLTQHLHP